jgi:hypothetical protein
MQLTEIEREIINTVVQRFLNLKESTTRKSLVIKFKEPEVLKRLVNCTILKTNDDETFLPLALAFHYCGDPDALQRAKTSLEVVLYVLRNLFEAAPDKTDFTAADVEAHARTMYGDITPEVIRRGLYLAQEFSVLSGWGVQSPGFEVTTLRISEQIVTLKNIEGIWDDHIRQYSARLELPEGQQHRAFIRDSLLKQQPTNLAPPTSKRIPPRQTPTHPEPRNAKSLSNDTGILVLISHSSKDTELASCLIELLRAGLGLRPDQIRCSSVDGYRLPAGVNTDAQLQVEVNIAKVVIGLMTPHSLASPYVLFELGARWGAKLPMVPLMAGVKSEELRGPLSGINALSATVEAQLHQLLANVSKSLDLPLQSAASYSRYISVVLQESQRITPAVPPPVTEYERLVFEESVCWKRKNGEREGPYCPVCYDDKEKAIHLTPGATRGTFSCGVCKNGFTTQEYDPRPAKRRPFSSR